MNRQVEADLLPDEPPIASLSGFVTFQGVSPGVTAKRERPSNETWGRAESHESITPLLTLLKYRLAGFEVSVAT